MSMMSTWNACQEFASSVVQIKYCSACFSTGKVPCLQWRWSHEMQANHCCFGAYVQTTSMFFCCKLLYLFRCVTRSACWVECLEIGPKRCPNRWKDLVTSPAQKERQIKFLDLGGLACKLGQQTLACTSNARTCGLGGVQPKPKPWSPFFPWWFWHEVWCAINDSARSARQFDGCLCIPWGHPVRIW